VASRFAAGALALTTPLATAAQAPDLVVPWTPGPIAVDGDSEAAWAAAETFFIGVDAHSITFRALHDGRTLYVQVLELSDDTHEPGAGAAILFDDEGGVPPLLGDGGWTASACSAFANRGEGTLGWFLTSQSPIAVEERWTEMTAGPACPTIVGQNGSNAAIWFEPSPVTGLATEVALPIEGSSALEVAAGERFGLHVDAYYVAQGVSYWLGFWPPAGQVLGDVALAALRCNGPVEEIDPRFPADWTNDAAGGPGWLRSGAAGCGVANATGAAGESACLVRGASTAQLGASLVSPWFSLLGESSAELSYRAIYIDAPASSNRLDLEARTTAAWAPLLSWTTTHGNPGGELVNVDLSGFANEPRIQLRWRYSVNKGDAGFGAQVDQVRLRCSPYLFSDAFESGLTTHWSAESP
jgi:hypothetical protein